MKIALLRKSNTKFSFLNMAFLMVLSLTLVAACASNPGDSRAKTGAKTGAAVGAGIGLLLGVLSGDSRVAARAVAVGAVAGAARGGYEGWRQDQDDERTRQITEAIRSSNRQQAGMDEEGRQREELTRLLGVWNMSGWFQAAGEPRVNVTAQVNANVQMNYFVEMAYIDLKAEGFDGQVWGTSTLGYDSKTGYSISTRFNTLDEAINASHGTFIAGTRSFVFADSSYNTTIAFQTPDRFVVTTTEYGSGGGEVVESYVFTRS